MSNVLFQLEHFLHNCYLRSALGRTSIILEDVCICSDCYFFYPYFYVEKTTIILFNNFWLSLNNSKGTAPDNCQKLALKSLAVFAKVWMFPLIVTFLVKHFRLILPFAFTFLDDKCIK